MSIIKVLKELSNEFDVLYVEDDLEIAEVFNMFLGKLFNKVDFATNGEEGLSLYKTNKYDLVITDIQMPKMDGITMSKFIKEINEEQNILIISAYSDAEKFVDSIKMGIDGYILKPIDYKNLNSVLLKIVTKMKKFKEHDLYEKNLEELVDIKTKKNTALEIEKSDNYKQVLFALIEIIEGRDTYTGKHSVRVAQYSKLIAAQLGLSNEDCEEIYTAGMLHDLGKVAIPDSLLLNPSKLTLDEYTMIKEHVDIGFTMLNKITMFKEIAQIVNCHHERLDGSGYPNALKGDEVPYKSNIMAVADTFDAMTTHRIYKARKTREEALLEINSLSGIYFKAEIVEAANKVFEEVTIDTTISQLPLTSMDEERFAYFYKDNLTHLYNEKYLDFILTKNLYDNYFKEINLIFIEKFSEYNKKFNWTKGNKLLMNFANELFSLNDNKFIFRIHGDVILILNADDNKFEPSSLKQLQAFMDEYNEDLKISLKTLDILEYKIDSISKLETLI